MPFEFNRYSGLLLIFFVHGIVYAFLLYRKSIKNQSRAEKWLALFLLCCVLYICPWMLGFAGWYEGSLCLECRNFMFYAPLQQTLLMAPAMYFYVRTLLTPSAPFSKKDWLHFLPFALYNLWILIVFITDRLVLHKYFLMNGEVDPDFDDWYILAGLISLLAYGIASLQLYRRFQRFAVQEYSFADALTFKWIRNFLIALFLYFLINLVFHLVQWMGIDLSYVDLWWYYLLFGMLFYYISITGYSNTLQTRQSFVLNNVSIHPSTEAETLSEITHDSANQASPLKMSDLEIESIKTAIARLMEEEKKYRDAELTLTALASELQIHPVKLSRFINVVYNMNFNDFINRYRVIEVKSRLTQKNNTQFTIMSLAYDAGFNSKTTFNRAFKKFTGQNPREITDSN